MMSLVKKSISLISSLSVFLSFTQARAQTYNFASSSGLSTTADVAGYTEKLKSLQPEGLAQQIIAQVLAWLGVAFLGLIIYGGVVWMTAQGNDQKVEKAKDIIIAAISGLVVVSLAYAISFFVINYFTTGSL